MNLKRKRSHKWELFVLFLAIIFGSCNNKPNTFTFKDIAEMEKLNLSDSVSYKSGIWYDIYFDTFQLADRFSFYSNGYIKNYEFIRNTSSSTYKITFDSISQAISFKGTPLVFSDYVLTKNKDTLKISGIVSSFPFKDFNIAILDNNTNISYKPAVSFFPYKRRLSFFLFDLPTNGKAVNITYSINCIGTAFKDTVFKDTISFKLIEF